MTFEGTEPTYSEPHWYACHTRARHEKQVEAELLRRGVEAYLPMYARMRQWKDRKKAVDWPLFPGYVLAHFPLHALSRVLATPGMATIVRSNGRPARIRAEEVENVRRFALALSQTSVEPELREFLGVGQRVRVRRGAFEGVEGVVLQRRNRRRVLVGLEAIRAGLEIDFEDGLLELIGAELSERDVPSPG
jgi:transcription antitermination factor NusG